MPIKGRVFVNLGSGLWLFVFFVGWLSLYDFIVLLAGSKVGLVLPHARPHIRGKDFRKGAPIYSKPPCLSS